MGEKKESRNTLGVKKGVPQPSVINSDSLNQFKSRVKKTLKIDEYLQGIFNGDKIILSQAITLLESTLPKHQKIASEIIKECQKRSGNSIRIGITGVPGVGKSTFIESLGQEIVNQGRKLAVLAIDPSSSKSRGSILGDKTRMEKLVQLDEAYIRPSPSSGTLGGVAKKTRETILLCEAAGFNTIFIETVGVGQSETMAYSMVDFFILLMLAGAGDELQGIKRGIMEMADSIVINKADGDNIEKANLAKIEYQNALHLYPLPPSKWKPNVLTVSSIKGEGIDKVWEEILSYIHYIKQNKYFEKQRSEQSKYWMYESIDESLRNNFFNNPSIIKNIPEIEKKVINNEISPFEAAENLLKINNNK